MSFTEIALQWARRIAQAHGAALQSFSLDGIDSYTDADGSQVYVICATAYLAPGDEIPFELAA